MVQHVKDPVFSLQQLGWLQWHRFCSWPGNLHVLEAQPRKKDREREKWGGREREGEEEGGGKGRERKKKKRKREGEGGRKKRCFIKLAFSRMSKELHPGHLRVKMNT